jgi:hypothetical protein
VASGAAVQKRFAGRGLVVALAAVAIVIVFLGAAAGLLLYRFGFIGGGGETAETIEVPHASPAMAADGTQPTEPVSSDSTPASAGAADASSVAETPAPPASPGDSAPVESSATAPPSPASVPTAPGNPPRAAARAAARPAAAPPARTRGESADRQAAPPATPALPAMPATYIECTGAPEVCGALRTAIVEALQRDGVTVTRRADAADMVLSASAQPGETQSDQQFGTTFVVQSVTIDVAAEAPRLAGAEVSMPPPRTFTYDTRFGRDRIGDNARLVAGEVADGVMQFWKKNALKQ